MDTLGVILAVLLPFVAVYRRSGMSGAFWLNLLLCICFWIPGIIHAIYIVTKPEPRRRGRGRRR